VVVEGAGGKEMGGARSDVDQFGCEVNLSVLALAKHVKCQVVMVRKDIEC